MSSAKSAPDDNDIVFLLLLVPFAVSGLYALYLWVTVGFSSTLPQTVYLQVTENPDVFLVGFAAVIFAVVIDVVSKGPTVRRRALYQNSSALQIVAVAALALSLVMAWYAAGFNGGVAVSLVLQGKYAIIFPTAVIAFSFLMLPSVSLQRNQVRDLVIVLLLLAVPIAVYEIGKRDFALGLYSGLSLVIVAAYLYLRRPTIAGTRSAISTSLA